MKTTRYSREQVLRKKALYSDRYDGVVIDLDAQGNIVRIDIQHASDIMDLATLETESLPTAGSKSR